MPWDGPLIMIMSSLSGTVAHVLITVAVIVTGLVFAFTEHGSGARRLFGVAFGGALAPGAPSFITAVGVGRATVRVEGRAALRSLRRSGGRPFLPAPRRGAAWWTAPP